MRRRYFPGNLIDHFAGISNTSRSNMIMVNKFGHFFLLQLGSVGVEFTFDRPELVSFCSDWKGKGETNAITKQWDLISALQFEGWVDIKFRHFRGWWGETSSGFNGVVRYDSQSLCKHVLWDFFDKRKDIYLSRLVDSVSDLSYMRPSRDEWMMNRQEVL